MEFQSSKLTLLAKPFNWNGKRIGNCCNNKNKASKDQWICEILMPMTALRAAIEVNNPKQVNYLSFFNCEKEGTSFTRFAFQPYCTSVLLHEFLAENQSQARTFFVSGTSCAVTRGFIEKNFLHLRIDPHAIIMYGHHVEIFVGPRA